MATMLRLHPELRPKHLRNIGPHLVDGHRFPPTAVAKNLVGTPPLSVQLITQAGHRGSSLEALMPDLAPEGQARGLSGFWITQHAPRKGDGALMGTERHQLMAPLGQVWGELAKLAREVLVHQQQPHSQAA